MRTALGKDNLIMLGVVAAMTVGYLVTVYRQQSRVLESCKTQANSMRLQIAEDGEKAKRVPAMTREVESMKQRFNKEWDRQLPQRQELGGFLREIAGNLAQSNLSNTITQPGNPTKGSLYNRLPINMKFEGDFLSLTAFLKSIDSMSRLTRIDRLMIKPTEKDDALEIELGMNIYFTEQ
jgi:Tfp pilus assembly protein PilO